MKETSGSPSRVAGPAASAPRNLLEMHISRSYPRPAKSQTLAVGTTDSLCHSKSPIVIMTLLQVESHQHKGSGYLLNDLYVHFSSDSLG